jgi:hypothetical protein
MNRDLTTSFTRMVCEFGHALRWRGRWLHVDYGPCVPVWNQGAEYPRTYYHR